MSRLLTASLPMLLLLLGLVAAIPDNESEVTNSNAPLPDNWPDLLAQLENLSEDDTDQRQHLIQHMIRNRIGRIGSLLYPSTLQVLMVDAKIGPIGSLRYQNARRKNQSQLVHDWTSLVDDHMQQKGDPMEIELLRELGSESNQVMLAYKLYWMMDAPYKAAGAAIQFLYERCDYKSLPGYLFGRFVMGYASEPALSMLKEVVVPLLSPHSDSLLKTIADLFERWGRNPGASPQMLDIMPAHLLPYFVSKHPKSPGRLVNIPEFPLTLTPEQYGEIRYDYDVIRALHAFGIQLDLNSVLALPDMTTAELHELAPYLSAIGFERALDSYLPQGKSELIVELLRHPSLAIQLGSTWMSASSVYRAGQVAIEYGALEVLRGLLAIPDVKYYMMRQNQDWIDTINTLRQEIAGQSVLDKESLMEEMNLLLPPPAN